VSLIVEVRNLRKYFPIERGLFLKSRGFVKAIDDISFNVKRGTTLGIMGRSGSGKTTLAKLLLRFIPPSSGEIIYNPEEISNFRKDVQIIFQNPYQSLNPKMRIWDILIEPLIIHRLGDRKEKRSRVLTSIENVGLSGDILSRFPIEFSGGQRQRICLARSLILEPKFLILDEPVSSLDLTRQVEILDLLKRLKEKLYFSCIFITHNINLLKEISDSILVIEKGRVKSS
jgi:ABC-type glutathione transport system ATPase component